MIQSLGLGLRRYASVTGTKSVTTRRTCVAPPPAAGAVPPPCSGAAACATCAAAGCAVAAVPIDTARTTLSACVPAGAPLACKMYAAMPRYTSAASPPGLDGGIPFCMYCRRSALVRGAQRRRKSSPASCGASFAPPRSARWHAAQFSTYAARPALACAAVYTPAVAGACVPTSAIVITPAVTPAATVNTGKVLILITRSLYSPRSLGADTSSNTERTPAKEPRLCSSASALVPRVIRRRRSHRRGDAYASGNR